MDAPPSDFNRYYKAVARINGVGAIPVANTPEQFAEANRKEVAKWGKIIRENGIKAD
jgi:hypothetical protein